MGPRAERPEFSVAVAHLDGHMVVTVRGEIDLYTAPQLTDALDTALRLPSPRLILDLSAVTFMDSAACHALVRTRDHAESVDIGLELRGVGQPCRRVLEIAQLDELFTFTPAEDDSAS
jgi:anti-sigma B factor antagonist